MRARAPSGGRTRRPTTASQPTTTPQVRHKTQLGSVVHRLAGMPTQPDQPEIVPPGTPFIDPPGPSTPKGPEEPPVIPPGQPFIDPPAPDSPGVPDPNKPFVETRTSWLPLTAAR